MAYKKTLCADVLIIGGGMAAMFSAMKAKEQGADVLVVDKGYAGASGQSPYADAFTYLPPELDTKPATDRAWKLGEYLNNRDWCDLCFRASHDRYQELREMGVEFFEEPQAGSNGEAPPPPRPPSNDGIVMANIKGIRSIPTIRKHLEKMGVRFIDRVMVTNLVKGESGAVIGAVGLATQEDDLVWVFNAKAVVLCTGGTTYKPAGWPAHGLTGDGDAMAYRIGARITGKEFMDAHTTFQDNPMYSNFKHKFSVPKSRPPFKSITGADGKPVDDIGTLFIHNEFEVHAGNGPITAEMEDGSKRTINGATSNGLSVHKGEGVWAVGLEGGTDIPGLYAAGDALGNCQAGSVYPGGMALAGSASSGGIAGTACAKYALAKAEETISEDAVTEIEGTLFQAVQRQGGYDPRWVIKTLQNFMRPYFVSTIKEEKRLQAVLTMVEFLRDHMVPMLKANDTHELILALETKNMILNAEMRLCASLYRKESRGTHYREDYPQRDDDNFLAWVTLCDDNGVMKAEKVAIPEAWRPDPTLSYEEKYTTRLAKF